MTAADPGYRSSGEIEREVEQTRARVTETLEELRDRVSPGTLLDQLVDYARSSGGGDFVRNLSRSMRDNPIPVVLIGAGIGWLMVSNSRSPRRMTHDQAGNHEYDEGILMNHNRDYRRTEPIGSEDPAFSAASSDMTGSRSAQHRSDDKETRTDGRSGYVSRAASAAESAASAAGSAVSSAASTVGSAASSAYQGVSHAAGRATSTLSEAASSASDTAYWAGRRSYGAVVTARRSVFELFEEQPLLLGVVGLALGAALGAALPPTETENRYLGDTSDQLKRRAQEMGEEQYTKAKAVAERAFNEAVGEAEAQGLTVGAARESAKEAVRSFGDELEAIAEAKESAKSEAAKQNLGGAGG
jgi:ElaB/YqjD/DUF883 family membrane-anchored ribosome-binding protein